MFRRYTGISKAGGSGFKASVAAAIVIYIWIHNISFNIPIIVWTKLRVSRRSGGFACYPALDDNYMLVTRIINFYLPLAITWASYIGIIYKLRKSIHKAVLFVAYGLLIIIRVFDDIILSCIFWFLTYVSQNAHLCVQYFHSNSNIEISNKIAFLIC